MKSGEEGVVIEKRGKGEGSGKKKKTEKIKYLIIIFRSRVIHGVRLGKFLCFTCTCLHHKKKVMVRTYYKLCKFSKGIKKLTP